MALRNYTPIACSPGIQRDGTPYSSASFIDGQHVRFYMGKPRKIGGAKSIALCPGVPVNMFSYPADPNICLFVFANIDNTFTLLKYVFNVKNGELVSVAMEPLTYPLPIDDDYWVQGQEFEYVSGDIVTFRTTLDGMLYAYPQFVFMCKESTKVTGDITSNVYFVSTADNLRSDIEVRAIRDVNLGGEIAVSGGVITLNGYIFAYGSNGVLFYNDRTANDPMNTWSTEIAGVYSYNEMIIAKTNLVQAKQIMGSQTALVFWALDSVITLQIGDLPKDFVATTVSSNSSIIAADSVVEYNGSFVWIGLDCFYQFNSNVSVLRNSYNQDWFFSNLNRDCAGNISGMNNKKYNEIWWFFPKGESKTNNHVLIYNYENNIWYDTPMNRAVGTSKTFTMHPLAMTNPIDGNFYIMKQESGWDETIIEGKPQAIESYVTYNHTNFYNQENGAQNKAIQVERIEVDAEQEGGLLFEMFCYNTPRDTSYSKEFIDATFKCPKGKDSKTLKKYTADRYTNAIDFHAQGRIINLRITNNDLNGFYQIGNLSLAWKFGDSKEATVRNEVAAEAKAADYVKISINKMPAYG